MIKDAASEDPSTTAPIFFSAGEVSGDIAAARVASELRRLNPKLHLVGLGSRHMAAAGVELYADVRELGAVGAAELLAVVPRGLKVGLELRRRLQQQLPSVALLIGNDVFNAFVGRWLRRRGVPTLVYFPPQVWLWEKFLPLYLGSYDLILSSFPDEQEVFSKAGAKTVFVGHYLTDALAPTTDKDRSDAQRLLGFDRPRRFVGIFPGSREVEIQRLGPSLLDAAKRLARDDPDLRFAIASAAPAFDRGLERWVQERGLQNCTSVTNQNRLVMAASDLLLLSSGTATLEAALLEIPMISVYRLSWFTIGFLEFWAIFGMMKREGNVALPNVLTKRTVIPEIQQTEVTAANIANQARGLLDDHDRRQTMRRELASIRNLLAVGETHRKVAEHVLTAARTAPDD